MQQHPRNIADDQIKACAQSGGVIGVVGFDGFLPGRTVSVDSVTQAIDYLAEKAGIDHVGIGLDWVYCQDMFKLALRANQTTFPTGADGDYDTPTEFLGPALLPEITQGLIDRGYSDADIRKVLGENWLRVGRTIWGR